MRESSPALNPQILVPDAATGFWARCRDAYRDLDPRLPVGLSLLTYLVLGFTVLGFNRSFDQALITTATAAAFEVLLCRVFRGHWVWPWSAIITSISLSILLNYSHNYVLLFFPVFFAIGSKYIFTFNGRHVLNPAMAGVSFSLLFAHELITAAPAYQWTGVGQMSVFIFGLALLFVIPKAGRTWLVASFLFWFTLQTALRAMIMRHHLPFETLFLGTLSSPAFFLFTFFMITDPATSPASRKEQLWVGFWLATLDLALHLKQSYYTFFYAALILGSVRLSWRHVQVARAAGWWVWWRERFWQSGYWKRPLLLGSMMFAGYQAYAGWLEPKWEKEAVHFEMQAVDPQAANVPVGHATQEVYLRVDPRVQHVAKWILSIGDAVAVGDVDGDGRPDVFVTQLLKGDEVRNALLRNISSGGELRFERVPLPVIDELTRHYEREGLVAGANFVDYDNDGDQDLWLQVGFGSSRLLRNHLVEVGRLEFTDVTRETGLWGYTQSMAATWADFDRDGRLDVLVANVWPEFLPNYAEPKRLNIFSLPQPEYEGDERMFDFMHDSWHLSNNGGENVLYLQTEPGRFKAASEVANTWRMPETRWSLAVSAADFNRDGWPDLYVANDFGPDDFYLNEEGRGFRAIRGEMFGSIGRDTYKGMNATTADFDRNGWMDMYVSNVHQALQAEGSLLWLFGPPTRQEGKLVVPEAIESATRTGALNPQRFGWGAAAADFDNDGWMDLLQANGMVDDSVDSTLVDKRPRPANETCRDYWYVNEKVARSPPSIHRFANKWGDIRGYCIYGAERPRLYWNRGIEARPQFVDIAEQVGVRELSPSRGVGVADFDGDGRMDAWITRQFAAPLIYLNRARAQHSTGHWMGVIVEGDARRCPRQALGARVELSLPDGQVLVDQAVSANGLSASQDGRMHFGLGAARSARVRVSFCGEPLQDLGRWEAGRVHRFRQDKVIGGEP